MKKDLFICHASEDKDDFVRPLANLLVDYGVNLWYDEFELRVGVSISRTIEKGIKNSNYGLIVLSRAFFNKNWTEFELKSFNAYEIESGDILLPLWKDVSFKEVREFSPYLADKFALTTKESIEDIAIKIIETIKPDLFSEIHKKIWLKSAMKNATIETINLKDIRPGPIQHKKLNENLISRIRLIRACLWPCYPHSMSYWLDGFQRDLNIEQEIRFWEKISYCYWELLLQHKAIDSYIGEKDGFYKGLIDLLFNISNPEYESKLKNDPFTEDFITKANEIISYSSPIYDIKEKPFASNYD